MTEREARGGQVRSSLDAERSLILSLGGYALEYAGGRLVLHEKIPVPRFNFVEIGRLSPQRQAGFFERALDQYFQRALRPTFRVTMPVAPYLDRTLHDLGFRPREEPLSLLGRTLRGRPPPVEAAEVRFGPHVPTSTIVPFWAASREAPELSSALEILRHHPNPGETIVPVLALEEDRPVGVGLVYSRGDGAFVFGVSTSPEARGHGVASSILGGILRHSPSNRQPFTATLTESRRLERKLGTMGFRVWARWRVYELAPDAELSVPPVAPSTGPLWRPPRGPGSPEAR